jgi:hypothetical protein
MTMSGGQRQAAVIRATNALIRALGGASVKVRVAQGVAEGMQRELGLAATGYQELELSPVLLRNIGGEHEEVEMLVSASVLNQAMPACGVADGMEFLKTVQTIVSGGQVYVMTEVSAERFAGVDYLYRVKAIR